MQTGDLKSSNILLCVSPSSPYGRTAKIADFGLARMYAAGETHKSTRTLGTVSSPCVACWGRAYPALFNAHVTAGMAGLGHQLSEHCGAVVCKDRLSLLCSAELDPAKQINKTCCKGASTKHRAVYCVPRMCPQINHMAPELLRFGKASAAADVYSFGIMMWELLTGEAAFQGWQWGAIIENVALNGQRPTIPATAPEDYCLLVESCWHQSPAQRPNFDEVGGCGWGKGRQTRCICLQLIAGTTLL